MSAGNAISALACVIAFLQLSCTFHTTDHDLFHHQAGLEGQE